MVAFTIHILGALSLLFGFIVVTELFQIFFGTELGLSFEYFTIVALLGILFGGFFALWLHYILVPFVKAYHVICGNTYFNLISQININPS